MLQFIYNHSPIFLQNKMISIKGKKIIKERYNENYYNELKYLRTINDEFEIQQYRLNEFLNYIRCNSNYFHEILKKVPENVKMEDMKLVPYMNKDTVRRNLKEMVTRERSLIKMKTGGSTGKSLTYFTHPYDISRKIAYLDYFKEKHGVYKDMRRVSIGGRVIVPNNQRSTVYWRYNKPLNQLLLSAYHADGENLKFYIEKLNRFKPQSIDGFTSTIHRLAKYILDKNISLKFKPIAIFPTAETLTPEMKIDIERAFKCPVRNQYASSEGAPFITENNKGILEINPATGVFELEHIQDNIYELIVTGFYTTTTPLLRYRIEDSVELYEKLPKEYTQKDIKIKRIIGRNNDFLISNERGIITNVNLSTIVKEGGTQIIASQFVQDNIDKIKIYLVIENNTNKSELEKKMLLSLKTRFGDSTNFEFYYLDEIPKTKGGKTRFTINNLK